MVFEVIGVDEHARARMQCERQMTQFKALKYNGEVNAGSEGTSKGEDKK